MHHMYIYFRGCTGTEVGLLSPEEKHFFFYIRVIKWPLAFYSVPNSKSKVSPICIMQNLFR